jgi:hypothetical protein
MFSFGEVFSKWRKAGAMCGVSEPKIEVPELVWAAGQRPAPRLRHHARGDMGEKPVEIDVCMVGLVKQLNDSGFVTASCCCGHHKTDCYIQLENGACLIIHLNEDKISIATEVPPYYSKYNTEYPHCATDGLTFEKLEPYLQQALLEGAGI